VSSTLTLTPWRLRYAHKDPTVVSRWLRTVADASETAFKGGMRGYPPASNSGQYPAVRSGRLRGSISTNVDADRMEVGSNAPYSIYLRLGTSRMRRRKMSDDAIKEGLDASKGRLGHWVTWSRL
jgi:phage gpG-like protein